MVKKILCVVSSLIGFVVVSHLGFQPGLVYATEGISIEKAKDIALQNVKGKIVNVETEVDDGVTKYEVIVQSSKGMYEVEIDKETGKVLEVEREGTNVEGDDDDRHDDDRHDDDDRYDD
ncbi:PepSY domain-containing protein [Bacillus sp. V5-8f]|uniref:PepSY domain-containing protein n=1 Tax=Bacillus sp. V5-8f TaxID=2053044 RepID=UPI000C78FA2E|nr:PepSY domain-containing protein [Bacillus sp. V5-8f]PLT33364.1 hypothetical protein CUU64_13790 [Bacillus sp. V5-8f]